jgi:hypothetical protein
MNAFLSSLKADLLDSRLRVALIVLAVALAAAVAYAVLGGGSSSAPVSASPAPVATGVAGIAIQPPSSTQQAVTETTSGSSHETASSRNPFTPLPEAKATSTAASTSSSTASSSAKSATQTASSTSSTSSTPASSSHGSSGSSTPSKPSTPAKPPAPTTVYHVALLFGLIPADTPPQNVALTPYENVGRLTPLPSSKKPLLVYMGVTTGGKSANFTVVGEVILRGKAICLPSASQCQTIELKPGQSEELEYAPPGGQAAETYELQLVSISSSKASSARAARLLHAELKAGRALLLRAGLSLAPGLH